MEPVMTQPTDGDSLKMCETDDGSMSLSYAMASVLYYCFLCIDATYRNLLLRDNHGAVLAPHSQRCDVRCRDCLECILCTAAVLAGVHERRLASCGAGQLSSMRVWWGTYRLGIDDPGQRRW